MPHSGIDYLCSLPFWDGKTYCPIDVPKKLLGCFDNPQDDIRAVHVTGTNGKGTVSSFAAAMLLSSGARVGQFASPHLSHVCERCLINGVPVPEEILGSAVEKVAEVARREKLDPSFFVVCAVASFLVFRELHLDWMIIEVGLGGRLDATNVMKRPSAAVITSIGLEHTQVLGKTVAEIAKEKAGIMRYGVPTYVGLVPAEAGEVLVAEALRNGSAIELLGRDFFYDEELRSVKFSGGELVLPRDFPNQQARHHLLNAVLAVRLGSALGLDAESISRGLQLARWPGRLESFVLAMPEKPCRRVEVLFDAAHNPDGISALCEFLKQEIQVRTSIGTIVFVLSFLDRKDWQAMSETLLSFAQQMRAACGLEARWILTHSGNQNAVPPSVLAPMFPKAMVVESAEQAFQKKEEGIFRQDLEEPRGDTLVVVTGSIYLLGKIRPLVTDEPFRTIAA